MRTNTRTLGLSAAEAKRRAYLGSMGVYLFRFEVLRDVLEREQRLIDFAKEIIPHALPTLDVHAYLFDGYWEDIGTIGTFYEAHMDLLEALPPYNLFDEHHPLYTHCRSLPGPKVNRGTIERSIIGGGAIVENAVIRRSIVGLRTRIGAGTRLSDAIVMGSDVYELPWEAAGKLPLGIGENCRIRRTIVDKNARIGNGVILENRRRLETYDDPAERFYIRSGIIVVPKGATIESGTEI